MDPADPNRTTPAKLREGLNELAGELVRIEGGNESRFLAARNIIAELHDVVDQIDGGGA